MSKIVENSISYLEQSKVGLLITVGEGQIPYARPIGAFANEGADIFFLTAKLAEKVKQIALNPIVTFYLEDEGQLYEKFKSVAITGTASEVTSISEFNKAAEAISIKYPAIKEKISNGEIKKSAIYKVKADFVKLADYTKTPHEVIEKI